MLVYELHDAALMSSHDVVNQESAFCHRYAQILPYKVARLYALISLLHTHETDIAILRRALREANQLKGTAGVYGFVQVSQYAGMVERALMAWTAQVNWASISQLLNRLLAVAKAQCEHSLAMSSYEDPGEEAGEEDH